MSSENVEDILSARLPVWKHLSDEERSRAADSARLQTYEQGAQIHNGSNDCVGALIVLSGTLKVSMLADSGRSISLFRISEGDTCVLSGSCALSSVTFDVFIDAQTNVNLLVIPSDTLKALMANPWMEAFVYKTNAERFSEVMWVFYQVLFESFDKRLAAYLLEEAKRSARSESNHPCTLHRTHEQIAKDLGSAREVVSRMLKRFEQEGLVDMSRGSITLANVQGLEGVASRE